MTTKNLSINEQIKALNPSLRRVAERIVAIKDAADGVTAAREVLEEQKDALSAAVKGQARTPELMECVSVCLMAMYPCQVLPTTQGSLSFEGKLADAARSFYFRNVSPLIPKLRKAKASKAKPVSAVERAAKQLEKKLTKSQIKALIAALKAYVA